MTCLDAIHAVAGDELTISLDLSQDMTGYTVLGRLSLSNGTVVERTAVFSDVSAGEATVTFLPADIIAGKQELEIVIEQDSDGTTTTLPADNPLTVSVRASLEA